MVEYISLRARTHRSRALHGSIFASRVSRDSLEGRVNSSLAPIMRLATSTSTPRARARSNARVERLARRSNARAGSRVVSRANADDASPSGLDDDAHVVLFGYGAQEVPRVRELVDALRAAVVDSGVDVGPVRVVSVSPEARGKKLDDVLAGALSGAADADGGDGERAVMLHGYSAKVLMPDLKMEMNEAGFEGAVFGVFTDTSRALALDSSRVVALPRAPLVGRGEVGAVRRERLARADAVAAVVSVSGAHVRTRAAEAMRLDTPSAIRAMALVPKLWVHGVADASVSPSASRVGFERASEPKCAAFIMG